MRALTAATWRRPVALNTAIGCGRAGLLLAVALTGASAASGTWGTVGAQAVRVTQRAQASPEGELRRVQAELRAIDQVIVRLQQSVERRPAPALLDSLQSTRQRQRQLRAQEQLLSTRADDRTRMQLQISRSTEARGWLGVEFNGAVVQHTPAGPMLVSANVPSIYSVSAGSPAARAGLVPGDRILAIAGSDVRSGPIPLGEVLQPGRQVLFRIERDGRGRDVRVRITEAPEQWIALRSVVDSVLVAALPEWETPWSIRIDTTGSEWAQVVRALGSDQLGRIAGVSAVAGGRGGNVTFRVRGTPDRGTASRVTIINQLRSTAPSPFVFSFDEVALLGAAFRGMTVGMRTELNAPEGGVIVVDVAPGTPAGRAGLRPLDVVVRANGELVLNPATLQRLVLAAERELRLELVREQKPVRTTVRW